ncbi:hypothetical protein [Streptomyces sp. HB2AG]|uniref:hypothetical protein n=1 Tax=Streptomyces sp. HB2AG TaxID=2983400 RepID=UPI0022AA2CAB|nr:hypothetical protein [Streptomyces sp. HB2AG]MCZ2525194.1 hypothetical protein [Streptomyces sp. HB2AG]
MTLVARLPAWIKRAKNREEVLRAVGRLHASLGPGPPAGERNRRGAPASPVS